MKPHAIKETTGPHSRMIFGVVLVIFALLVSSVFTFNRNLGSRLEDNAVERMLDIADSQRALILAHLAGMERELKTDVANIRSDGTAIREDVFSRLKNLVATGSFRWLCVSRFDGTARCTGCSDHPALSSDTINSVMKGEYSVDIVNNAVAITVPVYNDAGEVICALSGGYPTTKLTEFSGDFVRRYNGNLFIVQQEGDLLASAGDTRRLTGSWNHLDQFFESVTFETGSADAIYANMKLSIRDRAIVRSGRQRLLITYSPMDVDGWYICSMVPYSMVENDVNNIRNDAFGISVGLILAFSLVIAYLLVANRRQLEALRRQQKEMRASDTRYRLISARNKDVIVEYDLRKELVLHCENAPQLEAADFRGVNFSQKLISMGIIHPEDAGLFHDSVNAAGEGQDDVELEVRVKLSSAGYSWYRLSMACVFDERGNPWRVVARANNIDQQKREAQLLEQRAVRDPLTKLYNKDGTRCETDKILCDLPERCHALMILDIDNFKHFNDNYGHLFGDKVLSTAAAKMQELFRSSDVLGRVGGDEFLIFCRDIGSSANALRRAQQVVSLMRDVGASLVPPVSTSCSVGVALTPVHGVQFEELYANADSALYAAKARGKDGYALFGEEKMGTTATES